MNAGDAMMCHFFLHGFEVKLRVEIALKISQAAQPNELNVPEGKFL